MFEEENENEDVNIRTITISNGTYFTMRFEKEDGRDLVDVYQMFDEDNEIYLMSMRKEDIVDIIYQLEEMLNG